MLNQELFWVEFWWEKGESLIFHPLKCAVYVACWMFQDERLPVMK